MSNITRGDPPNLTNVRKTIYHHYIRVDHPKSLIFLSGQLARDADGKLVGAGDMAEQTRQCIRNMRTVLEAAGGTLEDIVSIVVYTTDMREFKRIVEARMEFFVDKLPTSTIVEVNHLADPGLMIEFQAMAAL
ncbi:MAG: RidA family protein [Burkholderiales bacterium]|nr:RidA family protein [Burkholderiales bacterium]